MGRSRGRRKNDSSISDLVIARRLRPGLLGISGQSISRLLFLRISRRRKAPLIHQAAADACSIIGHCHRRRVRLCCTSAHRGNKHQRGGARSDFQNGSQHLVLLAPKLTHEAGPSSFVLMHMVGGVANVHHAAPETNPRHFIPEKSPFLTRFFGKLDWHEACSSRLQPFSTGFAGRLGKRSNGPRVTCAGNPHQGKGIVQ